MTHVAVIGAGIIGAALADRLTQQGLTVTVLDSGAPGTGTSGSSLAWLNSNQKLPRHYHDLSARAMAEWRAVAEGLGRPAWYVPTGSLTWAEDDRDRAALGERLDRLRAWDYPAEELTVGQAAELEPALRIPAGASVGFFPADGYVDGEQAVVALLDRARSAGARVITTGGDVTLEAQGSRISAVRLPGGDRLQADVYVCCAGWRSPALLEPVGVRVPIVAGDAPGSAAPCLVTRVPGAQVLHRVINAPGLSLRPTAGGGVQLESGEVNTHVDTRSTAADLDRHGAQLLHRAAELIAGFTGAQPRHRVCIRPLPEDGHPVVGPVPELDNAYLVVTHSGMTLAALLARLVAGEIAGAEAAGQLAPYRPARFATA